MHLRYDEDLVEAAVHLCATGRRPGIPPLQTARFQREREKLYAILDPDDRDTAFFNLHLEWFREWGLEKLLSGSLPEFPRLPEALKVLAFRKSRGGNDDGAELYVNETGDRSGVVTLRPELLVREEELDSFLRHELTHLHDLVDPAFGFRPELQVCRTSLSRHRMVHERYHLLWDITIEGRLSRRGRPTRVAREQRWSAFAAAFACWTERKRHEVFDALWTTPLPTHRILEELARDPRGPAPGGGPVPGAPCPLCGFCTFAWADAASLAPETVTAILAEFPHWTVEQGVCARCREVYRVRHSPTPTVL